MQSAIKKCTCGSFIKVRGFELFGLKQDAGLNQQIPWNRRKADAAPPALVLSLVGVPGATAFPFAVLVAPGQISAAVAKASHGAGSVIISHPSAQRLPGSRPACEGNGTTPAKHCRSRSVPSTKKG